MEHAILIALIKKLTPILEEQDILLNVTIDEEIIKQPAEDNEQQTEDRPNNNRRIQIDESVNCYERTATEDLLRRIKVLRSK
ncbi:unnamed protein product [Rhizophagus irregularis]|nr:unnamed protein product [Rhizophagus irregularis]